jgi:hypothetical protein
MYGGGGGGHYDGGSGGAGNANALFGGGGFMPSQSTVVPENSGLSKVLPNSPLFCFLSSICSPSYADPSWALPIDRCGGQGRSAQTLLPLTVKQTMDAAQTSGDRSNFAINGVEVSTVRILPFFPALLRLRPHIGVQHVFLFFCVLGSLGGGGGGTCACKVCVWVVTVLGWKICSLVHPLFMKGEK